jgi:hypothetical protein
MHGPSRSRVSRRAPPRTSRSHVYRLAHRAARNARACSGRREDPAECRSSRHQRRTAHARARLTPARCRSRDGDRTHGLPHDRARGRRARRGARRRRAGHAAARLPRDRRSGGDPTLAASSGPSRSRSPVASPSNACSFPQGVSTARLEQRSGISRRPRSSRRSPITRQRSYSPPPRASSTRPSSPSQSAGTASASSSPSSPRIPSLASIGT